MPRRADSSELIGGQDSFLDIVANLVGILIILVVVVGAQASSVKSESVSTEDLDEELLVKQVESTQLNERVKRMTIDNHQLEQDISDEKFLSKQLADERHVKMMQLEQVRQEIARRTEDWGEYQREVFQNRVNIDSLKQQLTNVHQELNAWQNEELTRVETIEHFPTPIAKTVFTDEIHFRLSDGRISYVPMDPLLEEMKSQWKVVAESLVNSDQAVETVGPIDGYRLQYELRKSIATRQTERGPVRGEVVQFDHFTILPAGTQLGESIEQAMTSGSEFSRRLADHQPQRTTISIWVYPNSYGEFMVLKKQLHQAGFQIASWPLDEGRPISGGPKGFKTSAQ